MKMSSAYWSIAEWIVLKILSESNMSVAAALRQPPHAGVYPAVIKGIYLTGGIARRGWSYKDVDLVIVVSNEVSQEFINKINEAEAGYVFADLRSYLALSDFLQLPQSVIDTLSAMTLKPDIFLFPEDWKTNQQLRWALASSDRELIDNLARDAIRFDPITQQFENAFVPRLKGAIQWHLVKSRIFKFVVQRMQILRNQWRLFPLRLKRAWREFKNPSTSDNLLYQRVDGWPKPDITFRDRIRWAKRGFEYF